MKKFYLPFLCILLFASNGLTQTLIDPATDGGFEIGTTFPLNGWTAVNDGNNKWYVGAVAKTAGARGVYIDLNNTAGTANTYNNGTARVSYIYKDVTFPAGATNITLSFKWRANGENGSGADDYDFLRVFLPATTVTPVAGTLLPTNVTNNVIGTGKYNLSSTTVFQTATIPLASATYAGTAKRLIFCWRNDGAFGNNPPAALDEISLTYTPCVAPAISPAGQPDAIVTGCAGTTVNLNVTATGTSLSYQWYKGAAMVAGANSSTLSFNPASVSNNGTYTVVVSNACGTVTSNASVVTITASPTAYNVTGTGGYCVGGSGLNVGLSNSQAGVNYQLVKNGTNSGSPILSTGGALDFGIQTAGTYTITANDPASGCSATMTGSAVVTQNPLPQGSFTGNNACIGTTTGQITFSSSSGTGLFTVTYNDGVNPDVVKSGVASGTPFNVSPNPSVTTTYNIVSVSDANSCIRSSGFTGGSTVTVTVNPLPTVASTTPASRCGTGTVTISAAASSGATIDWYSAATGGTLLLSGNVNYSPSVSSTTTYYTEARNTTTGCVSLSRSAVTATVNPSPGAPTTPVPSSICGSGTATISASVPGGITIDWYSVSSGGSVLAGGTGTTSFNTPNISSTTTYYAEARNATTGCVSSTRLAVTVTINPLPQGSFTGNTICTGGTGTLTWAASAGTGNYTIIYNPGNITKTGAVSGNAFNASPNPSITTAYTLINVTDANGCSRSSGFTSGATTITVNPLPTVTGSTSSSRCGTGTVTISATASAGATIDWYAAATGGTAIASGSTYTTPSIAATTTYYAEARNTTTGCISALPRTSVTATVNSNPTVYAVTGGGAYCIGGSGVIIGLSGSQNSVSYTLTPGAQTLNGTGSAFNFGNKTAAGVYTVSATTAAGCTLPMAGNATIMINNPVITSATGTPSSNVCLGSPVNLVTVPSGSTNVTLLSENFEATNSFYVVNTGTTTAGSEWNLRSSPFTQSTTFNSGSKFMLSVSDGYANTNTTLVSPTVNTQGYISLTLTYRTYFKNIGAGDDNLVDVSINNGASWTNVAPATATIGAANNFATQIVDLSAYINKPSLLIRFNYSATNDWYWAIDDVSLTGTSPLKYSWTSTANGGLPAGAGTPSIANSNINATPTALGSITYTATLIDGIGCTSPTKDVAITAIPAPVVNTQPADRVACIGDTLGIKADVNAAPGATYQWRRGTTNLVNSAHITGANTDSLTINSIVAGDQGNDYNLVITNSNNCSVTTNNFTLTVNQPITINLQPIDKVVCAGTNVTFSVNATGGSFTYQWRKGDDDIADGGNISGATTKNLTITGATSADAAGDYNVVITGNCVASEISDYVSLTVNNAAVTPTTQASFMLFPTVNPTSVLVSFNPSPDATNYLIIVKSNTTPPAASFPADGTTYTAGTGTLTGTNGRVEYVGTNTYVTSNGLSPNTTYYYYIYAYNKSSCGVATRYLKPALTGSVTTGTNNSCGTPIATLYWGGKGSIHLGTNGTDFNTAANWSTSASSYIASPSVPGGCNDVFIQLNDNVTITLSQNDSVNNLTLTEQGGGIGYLSTEGKILTVNGDALINTLAAGGGGNVYMGEKTNGLKGIIDFKANVSLGPNLNGVSFLIGHTGSKIIFRGDFVLGKGAATPTNARPDTVEFDGPGLQQVTWNNNNYYANFTNIVVGHFNNPIVRHVTGTYVPDNILHSLTINGSSVLDLAQSQWNCLDNSCIFKMNATSKLQLGNDHSSPDDGNPNGPNAGIMVPGSNYPGGFSSITLSPISTIEYNGDNTITQTVYTMPSSVAYGNLVLSNSAGAGNAAKISTGLVTVGDTTIIDTLTTFTPGSNVVSNGKAFVKGGGTLNLNNPARIVSGTGEFNIKVNGNLIITNLQGISAVPASTGHITTAVRNYGTAGNFSYIGSGAQLTGDGLPKSMNRLTINNASGVTMYAGSRNYMVSDSLTLTTGALVLNGDTITFNKFKRTNGTFTGSSTSSIGMTSPNNYSLFFTAGARILKDLFLTTNAKGTLGVGQHLDIAGGATPGSITVGAGATFTAHDSLALKSDALGTARVGPIPQDASGNALGFIPGNVVIERYYPGRRAWRLVTAPVSTTRTIYNEWQIGGKPATLAPGSGTYITSPTGGNGLDVSLHFSMKTYNQATGMLEGVNNTKVPISGSLKQLNVPDNIGYFLFVRGDRTPALLNPYPLTNYNNTTLRDTGVLQTGKKTFGPVAAGKIMLIGNPYASPVNFANLQLTNVPKKFWAWDPRINDNLGSNVYVDGQSGSYIIVPSPDPPQGSGQDQYIQSSQAIYVQASSAGAGTVEFNESCKVLASNNTVFRPVLSANDTLINESLRVNLYLDNGDTAILADGIYEQFNNNFSLNVDDLDALKFTNILETFGIVRNGQILTLERRPLITGNDTIYFKLWNTSARNYQLRLSSHDLNHPGLEGYLEDKYLKTSTPIDLNGYTNINFNITSVASSKATDRFRIVFKSSVSGPLPVTFTSLKAYQKDKAINVEWNVDNEINMKSYEVERSVNGIEFTKVNTVTATGNNGISINYQWPDADVRQGTYYYRIRGISNSGEVKYTGIVKISIGNGIPLITVYPNPVSGDKINIQLVNQPKGSYGIRLLNKLGQLISIKQVKHQQGSSTETLPLSKTLAHGVYQLEVTRPEGNKTNINVLY